MLTRRATLVTGLAVAALASPVSAQNRRRGPADPRVQTRYGPVTGVTSDGIAVFKGLRYGASTADRRFRPAVAPTAWTDPVRARSPTVCARQRWERSRGRSI